MKIEIGKKYKTRNGDVIVITEKTENTIYGGGSLPPFMASINKNWSRFYYENGRTSQREEPGENDIVEEVG